MRPIALAVLACLLAFVSTVGADQGAQTPAAERPPGHRASALTGTRVASDGCGGLPEELRPLLGSAAPPGTPIESFEPSGRPCDLVCTGCPIWENEPDCSDDYIDESNGGCNSAPPVFRTILPQAAHPFQICGTSGTFLVGGTETWRDTDWFEITLTQTSFITFTCVAEFPLRIAILDGNPGCPSVPVIEMLDVAECEEAVVSASLDPGTYWLWVGPQVFTGVPCGSDYIATVDGYHTTCAIECPSGSVVEGPEPCEPDYEDYYNGGCNWVPYSFLPLEPSPDMIVLCGEAWTYDYGGTCYREMDWFEMPLGEASEIEFCAAAEFPLAIWLISPGPPPDPCVGQVLIDFQLAPVCEAACISAVLEPGTYWLIVAPSEWVPIGCGASYTMTLSGYTTPVEEVSWGSVKALYR